MAVVTPKIWSPTDIATTDFNADEGSVTMLPNGGYVMTWREQQKIAFQVYDGTGAKIGGKSFVQDSGLLQRYSDVVSYNADGGFVISWTEDQPTNRVLRVQKFNADGTSNGLATITNSTALDGAPQIVANGNGGWAVAYSGLSGDKNALRLTQFDSNGVETNSVVILEGTSNRPEITWLGGTKYAVTYLANNGINIQIVDGSGNGSVGPVSSIAGAEQGKVVALKGADGLPTGQFVIVANNDYKQPIIARTYTTDANGSITLTGTKEISPIQPSPYLPSQDLLSVTALRDGGYAVAFVAITDGWPEVWLRVVDASGQEGPAINVSALDRTQHTPAISEMADGRLAVSWRNPSYPNYGEGTMATKIVDARAQKVTVTGTSKNDIYAPSDHEGDDFDGGDGTDTLTFQAAGSGVGVHLGENRGTAGIAAGDTYTNFERIIGSNFADTLTGNDLANTIDGGAGNDVINGLGGDDVMNGGTGADTYFVNSTNDRINESAAADVDTVYSSATYTLSAYVENLFAISGAGAINLIGNDWNNTIVGNEAANSIEGGNGNDILNGADGNDILNAGAGNDVLDGGAGSDILSGGDGIDNLNGGVGNDNLDGGTGNDVLNGGDDNDILTGGEGIDNLTGGNGNDTLDGGNGDDVMQGGLGADVMKGGAGNDIYYIDDVNDTIEDVSGVDTVYLAVNYDVSRLGTIENITGVGSAAIALTGNAFNNVFTGNDGANILYGRAGNDVLNGGAGNDRIHGQEGSDILTGGTGNDLFVFDKRPHKSQNVDKITDYNVRDDSIYLENKYFKVTPAGSLSKPKQMASKHFFKGSKAHDRDDRIIYDNKKGVLYYDADGTGSSGQIKIATFDKKPNLIIKDFFVI